MSRRSASAGPEPDKARNAIARMFCRLQDFRRIAIRYDKLARNDLAAIVFYRVLLVTSPESLIAFKRIVIKKFIFLKRRYRKRYMREKFDPGSVEAPLSPSATACVVIGAASVFAAIVVAAIWSGKSILIYIEEPAGIFEFPATAGLASYLGIFAAAQASSASSLLSTSDRTGHCCFGRVCSGW